MTKIEKIQREVVSPQAEGYFLTHDFSFDVVIRHGLCPIIPRKGFGWFVYDVTASRSGYQTKRVTFAGLTPAGVTIAVDVLCKAFLHSAFPVN